MSGPKSSRYTLTPEQLKKILEEEERKRKQREEEARKKRETKEAVSFLSNILNKARQQLKIITEYESKLHPTDGQTESSLEKKIEQYKTVSKQLESICKTDSKDGYETVIKARKQAESIIGSLMISGEELIIEAKEMILHQRIQSDSEIAGNMQVSFESFGIYEEEEDSTVTQAVSELEELRKNDLSKELNEKIDDAIIRLKTFEYPSDRNNFISITIEPLKHKCLDYIEFVDKHADEYASAHDRYSALCDEVGIEEQDFEYSASGLSEMKKTISELELSLQKSLEQAYISQAIDEVMQEMGYEVIGKRDVTKRSGKSFSSRILSYDDGTVVNITESSTGMITMEIGGLDQEDRTPDSNERVELQKKMEAFCRDFKVIERMLSERGVIVDSRISLAPPKEEYAQIINYTDYVIINESAVSAASKKKASQTSKQMQIRNDHNDE